MDLIRDVPLDLKPGELIGIEPYDADEVKKLFDFLEFRTLFARLDEAFAPGEAVPETSKILSAAVVEPTDPDDAVAVLDELGDHDGAIALAGAFGPGDLEGLSLVLDEAAGRGAVSEFVGSG